MADKIKVPKKFTTTADFVYYHQRFLPTNAPDALTQVTPLYHPTTSKDFKSIPVAVQYKDGVMGAFDKKTERMWTVTAQPDPGLLSVLLTPEVIDVSGEWSVFAIVIKLPAEVASLAVVAGANPRQVLAICGKKLGVKKSVFQCRGYPFPTPTPTWSQVVEF